ncbi:unnamed protein product [Sphenostylis stenocarpa]|uniref:Uncharacterized protein n=1 Tax=Sphenostylis stenocarpa TaxID=92480 RepID=A0AA86SKW0_9FABA|nr:unnamed protein product [Sphenostylis stenocarpa]
MAVCDASQSLPKLQIEAVLSVPPFKATEPRRVRQVLMSDTDSMVRSQPKAIHGCYQIVLYYENLNEEEGDKFLAGWIVESLSSALVEHPLLSGRLRRKDSDEHWGMLEIVSNDSGIRLYEARFPMVLSEFLALSVEKEHLEAELAFWKEIDELNPQFSPLFYVQASSACCVYSFSHTYQLKLFEMDKVTQFECGGYTIGISCSLLLADVLVVENFLKTWAEIHNSMLHQREKINTPIFYHPLLIKNNEPPLADTIHRTKIRKAHTTAFKVIAKDLNFNEEFWREVAMLCVEEVDQKLHKGVWTKFNLFVKESSEVIKAEGHSKNEYCKKVFDQSLKNQISGATWNDFGECVTFHEGNKPVLVSRWIGSIGDDGNVIVVPCTEGKASALITQEAPPRRRQVVAYEGEKRVKVAVMTWQGGGVDPVAVGVGAGEGRVLGMHEQEHGTVEMIQYKQSVSTIIPSDNQFTMKRNQVPSPVVSSDPLWNLPRSRKKLI